MSDYDPVSKADVLETYADLYDVFEDNKAICKELDKIYDRLNTLPSAQSELQWLPCSKTIDMPDHEVLCCDRHGEELIGWLSYNDDQWLCESDGEMMYDPIAWREKPEPYKEGY